LRRWCLLSAPWVQLCIRAGSGWPHNVRRHHWLMPISCHFRDCKVLLVMSLAHVSGAITSVQTFTFTFLLYNFQIHSVCLRLNGLFYVSRRLCTVCRAIIFSHCPRHFPGVCASCANTGSTVRPVRPDARDGHRPATPTMAVGQHAVSVCKSIFVQKWNSPQRGKVPLYRCCYVQHTLWVTLGTSYSILDLEIFGRHDLI